MPRRILWQIDATWAFCLHVDAIQTILNNSRPDWSGALCEYMRAPQRMMSRMPAEEGKHEQGRSERARGVGEGRPS
jgi:hypothetical protein